MAATPIKDYLGRSIGILRRNTAKVMNMEVDPRTPPLSIFQFASSSKIPLTPIKSLATGSDSDIGGLSTCSLTPVFSVASEASSQGSQSHLSFHGNLSLKVPPKYAGRIRTGYSAFRNRTRPTFFGEETWDLGLYSHLRVVVGYRGWEGWRSRWVVNLQTDGPVRSDLFQHRLPLPPNPQSTSSRLPLDPTDPSPAEMTYSTLHLPLSQFVLTNSGLTSSTQIPMMRNKVRTIGFGLLGGGRGEEEIPPSPSATGLENEGEVMGRERLVAGGWGRPEEGETDAELEDLIRSESAGSIPRPTAGTGAVVRPGGYHDLSTGRGDVGGTIKSGNASVGVVEGSEGYYELCIKSVEAVKWDPEEGDEEGEL